MEHAYNLNYQNQAHAYIAQFKSLDEARGKKVNGHDLFELTLKYRNKLEYKFTEDSELAAFICLAAHNPENLVLFVDSYNIMRSGVPNFCCVALALQELGYEPGGMIADSKWLETMSYQV